MSSILKALKKLEEEKSALQDEKEINLSRDILKQPVTRGISVQWFWLAGILSIAVIVMLTVALIRKPQISETASHKELPSISRPATLPTPTQSLPATLAVTGINKGDSVTNPSPLQTLQTGPQPLLTPARVSILKNERIELPGGIAPSIEPLKTESAVKSIPVSAPLASDTTLTLSGIAWNKDSADRLAIINGQPTTTGTTVSGALVEEILPDRVKLFHHGRTFELLIGRSAVTD